jgi:hypothetical protein
MLHKITAKMPKTLGLDQNNENQLTIFGGSRRGNISGAATFCGKLINNKK